MLCRIENKFIRRSVLLLAIPFIILFCFLDCFTKIFMGTIKYVLFVFEVCWIGCDYKGDLYRGLDN